MRLGILTSFCISSACKCGNQSSARRIEEENWRKSSTKRRIRSSFVGGTFSTPFPLRFDSIKFGSDAQHSSSINGIEKRKWRIESIVDAERQNSRRLRKQSTMTFPPFCFTHVIDRLDSSIGSEIQRMSVETSSISTRSDFTSRETRSSLTFNLDQRSLLSSSNSISFSCGICQFHGHWKFSQIRTGRSSRRSRTILSFEHRTRCSTSEENVSSTSETWSQWYRWRINNQWLGLQRYGKSEQVTSLLHRVFIDFRFNPACLQCFVLSLLSAMFIPFEVCVFLSVCERQWSFFVSECPLPPPLNLLLLFLFRQLHNERHPTWDSLRIYV